MKQKRIKFVPIEVPKYIPDCTVTFSKNRDDTYLMNIHRNQDGYVLFYHARIKILKEKRNEISD